MIAFTKQLRAGSKAVSFAILDHDNVVISFVSVRIAAMRAHSVRSWLVGESGLSLSPSLDGDGLRDVASAAWLDLPGRCLISKCHGSVRCFSRNRRVFEISSNVLSPRILNQRFVVSDNNEIFTALGEVTCLL